MDAIESVPKGDSRSIRVLGSAKTLTLAETRSVFLIILSQVSTKRQSVSVFHQEHARRCTFTVLELDRDDPCVELVGEPLEIDHVFHDNFVILA